MIAQPAALPTASAGAMAVIGALLESRTGQQIAANRAWKIETAMKPLLRELGLDTLDLLVARLVAGADGALRDRVVDALLNQESSFFRDAQVLDGVGDAAQAMLTAANGRKLRLWSAGCSNGQEPLSLAMLFDERGIARDIDIVATDVSLAAIARARAARFSQFEIQRGLSVHRMVRWFGGEGNEWIADPVLAARIVWRRQNLVNDAPPAGGFDIILCRNVLLYLSGAIRQGVFDRLASALRPGGLLILGAGETVIGQTEAFVPSEDWRGMYRLTPRRVGVAPVRRTLRR